MNSLVKKPKSDDCSPSPCCSSGPSYPSFCLYDEQVKAFANGFKLEPGKVYETTIQFKVDGWRDSDHGKSLDICLLASDEIVETDEAPPAKEEKDPVVAVVVSGKYEDE